MYRTQTKFLSLSHGHKEKPQKVCVVIIQERERERERVDCFVTQKRVFLLRCVMKSNSTKGEKRAESRDGEISKRFERRARWIRALAKIFWREALRHQSYGREKFVFLSAELSFSIEILFFSLTLNPSHIFVPRTFSASSYTYTHTHAHTLNPQTRRRLCSSSWR